MGVTSTDGGGGEPGAPLSACGVRSVTGWLCGVRLTSSNPLLVRVTAFFSLVKHGVSAAIPVTPQGGIGMFFSARHDFLVV